MAKCNQLTPLPFKGLVIITAAQQRSFSNEYANGASVRFLNVIRLL